MPDGDKDKNGGGGEGGEGGHAKAARRVAQGSAAAGSCGLVRPAKGYKPPPVEAA